MTLDRASLCERFDRLGCFLQDVGRCGGCGGDLVRREQAIQGVCELPAGGELRAPAGVRLTLPPLPAPLVSASACAKESVQMLTRGVLVQR